VVLLDLPLPSTTEDSWEANSTVLIHRADAVGLRDLEPLKPANLALPESIQRKIVYRGDLTALYILQRRLSGQAGNLTHAHSTDRDSDEFIINLHLPAGSNSTPELLIIDRLVTTVRHALMRRDGRLRINLIPESVREHDRRGEQSLEPYRQFVGGEGVAFNVVDPIAELAGGFAVLSQADLAICCAYYPALTSLLLGLPTVVLSRTAELVQYEPLTPGRSIADAMLFDVERGRFEVLQDLLERLVSDDAWRARLAADVARESVRWSVTSARAVLAVGRIVDGGYFEALQRRYETTAQDLLQALEQLSHREFDLSRLLGYRDELQQARQHALELQDMLDQQVQSRAWRLAARYLRLRDRIKGTLRR
jgi:hypothetical protein